MAQKEENKHKAKVIKLLRESAPELIIFPHQDVRQCGIPDMSVTGKGKTTWWEFKYGTPDFTSNGYQELTARRLHNGGFCRYVIFIKHEDGAKETEIRLPHTLHLSDVSPEYWSEGFNYKGVVSQIIGWHWF